MASPFPARSQAPNAPIISPCPGSCLPCHAFATQGRILRAGGPTIALGRLVFFSVTPAKAGVQGASELLQSWIPAFAGVTTTERAGARWWDRFRAAPRAR